MQLKIKHVGKNTLEIALAILCNSLVDFDAITNLGWKS